MEERIQKFIMWWLMEYPVTVDMTGCDRKCTLTVQDEDVLFRNVRKNDSGTSQMSIHICFWAISGVLVAGSV
jgi:hypothetical protein